jgi:hypothetical protein
MDKQKAMLVEKRQKITKKVRAWPAIFSINETRAFRDHLSHDFVVTEGDRVPNERLTQTAVTIASVIYARRYEGERGV